MKQHHAKENYPVLRRSENDCWYTKGKVWKGLTIKCYKELSPEQKICVGNYNSSHTCQISVNRFSIYHMLLCSCLHGVHKNSQ